MMIQDQCNMERKLIVNRIKTPDGTILTSRHRHDYVTYKDANGLDYMLDGGNEYQRYIIQESAPFENLSLYTDSPFEEIRKEFCRGGRGKDGRQPLTWVPIANMSNSWLTACIPYNIERGFNESISTEMYRKELEYRKEHNIFIEDES